MELLYIAVYKNACSVDLHCNAPPSSTQRSTRSTSALQEGRGSVDVKGEFDIETTAIMKLYYRLETFAADATMSR